MKKKEILVIFPLLLLIVSCVPAPEERRVPAQEAIPTEEVQTMQLTSPAFAANGKIPAKYTCDEENISPPLQIADVPAAAQSFVLLMDDPDIPEFVKERYNISIWDHWIVFNIPPTTKNISEGKNPPGLLGKNTGGKNGYGGPCPPDREHRYFFKLYALDTTLALSEGAKKAEVEKAMEKHILAKAELVGRYERKS